MALPNKGITITMDENHFAISEPKDLFIIKYISKNFQMCVSLPLCVVFMHNMFGPFIHANIYLQY